MISAAATYTAEEKLYKRNLTPFSEDLTSNLQAITQDRMSTSDMPKHAFWAAKNNISTDIILGNVFIRAFW